MAKVYDVIDSKKWKKNDKAFISLQVLEETWTNDKGQERKSVLVKVTERFKYTVKLDRGKLKAGDAAWGESKEIPIKFLPEVIEALVSAWNEHGNGDALQLRAVNSPEEDPEEDDYNARDFEDDDIPF